MDYNNFKILIIGCGSIGKRHIGNLKMLGIKDLIICDTDGRVLKETSRKFNISNIYLDYKEAVLENKDLDAALVSTPTSLHISQALFLAKNKINIFMEKPLSNNLRGIAELIEIINKNKLIFMMGMCYRFHSGLKIIKELLEKKELGKVYAARCYGGHYLPDWHPKEDYSKGYAARRSLGGGVVLTSIHGYDYIRWLFGEVWEVFGYLDKVSNLKFDVEDIAIVLLKTDKDILVSSYIDFLERHKEHKIDIICERGNIQWDYNVNEVRVFDGITKRWRIIKFQFYTNDMYVNEIKYFLNCMQNKISDQSLNVNDGLKTLKLALSIKKSSSTKKIVYV